MSDPVLPRLSPAVVDRSAIRDALIAAFPSADWRELEDFAVGLCAVAERSDVPFERLRAWIWDQPDGKEFSLAAWRAYCERYAAARSAEPEKGAP